jgi:hypothetical protein
MARRGTKPLPPALHDARGTRSKVPGGVEVLVAGDGLVARPDGMTLAAQMVWDDYADHAMSMGTLKPADTMTFAQWCQMSADIQASWQPGSAPAPASFIQQWRTLGELFGLAGEKSRVVLKVTDGKAKDAGNPFARNGRRRG